MKGEAVRTSTSNHRRKLEEAAGTLGIDSTNKNDEELKSAIGHELNRK